VENQVSKGSQAYTLRKLIFLIFLFFKIILSSTLGMCQEAPDDVAIAHEYFLNGEYSKAQMLFEKLSKQEKNLALIYNDYTSTLLAQKDFNTLEKYMKKVLKTFPANPQYKADNYIFLTEIPNKESDAEKFYKNLENSSKNDRFAVKVIADIFIRKNKLDKALQLLEATRKASGDPYLFSTEIAGLLKMTGNEEKMIDELLNLVVRSPDEIENVKNTFQNNLSDKNGFEKLENKLYEQIQANPAEIVFNELLLWLNIQNKNFSKALMQAKAIDKRNKSNGFKLIEVGRIALENKDYKNAIPFFEQVVNDYKGTPNYQLGRKFLIKAKEGLLKTTFPIQESAIRSLITDYKVLIKEFGSNQYTAESMRGMALLYAFYLDEKDSSITILNEAIKVSGNDNTFKARAKIDLGDIYLLKEEPWEATLLYSQVEKLQKDETLGHEAKLRNAKLSYYKGEFDLAKAHLDVLKLATSREIANDAMELSLLIQDNTAFDTIGDALREYAAIDLLLFQNKVEEGLTRLNGLEKNYPGHALTDEIYWLKSKIFMKSGDFVKAAEYLQKIFSQYESGILGDDALYELGVINEEKLNNKEKAMEYYQQFLIKFPGSIFGVDVRKRIRNMRGDKI
jgi:tetratricopeptide (TPR) repeat protein